ncbi:MAG: hypothetical protein HUU56_12160 [Bdellovibrionaceae bacterium]|nr:hypothetical protein [Pseudobdellovibrionaceae bacterium]
MKGLHKIVTGITLLFSFATWSQERGGNGGDFTREELVNFIEKASEVVNYAAFSDDHEKIGSLSTIAAQVFNLKDQEFPEFTQSVLIIPSSLFIQGKKSSCLVSTNSFIRSVIEKQTGIEVFSKIVFYEDLSPLQKQSVDTSLNRALNGKERWISNYCLYGSKESRK